MPTCTQIQTSFLLVQHHKHPKTSFSTGATSSQTVLLNHANPEPREREALTDKRNFEHIPPSTTRHVQEPTRVSSVTLQTVPNPGSFHILHVRPRLFHKKEAFLSLLRHIFLRHNTHAPRATDDQIARGPSPKGSRELLLACRSRFDDIDERVT